MSQNTGIAPACIMEKAVAINVYEGQMTSSPGPISKEARAVCNADVPLVVVMQWLVPI